MGVVELFRAESEEEFKDVFARGKLRKIAGSVEGKWFAESAEDAAQWGKLLYGEQPFRIIAIQIEEASANQLFRLIKLDNIGPARFAEVEQLELRGVREVSYGKDS